jgi:hypothetical protein
VVVVAHADAVFGALLGCCVELCGRGLDGFGVLPVLVGRNGSITVVMPSSLAAAKISSWSWLSSGAWPEGAVRPFSFKAAPSSLAVATKLYGSTCVKPISATFLDGAGQVLLDGVAEGVELE